MADSFFIRDEMLKLSSQDRLQLYELTANLAADNEQYSQDDFLEMYLLEEKDWRKDYARLKGNRPAKSS
jgi:hypothetical protein